MVKQRVTRLSNPRKRRKTSTAKRNKSGQFVRRRKVNGSRRKVAARAKPRKRVTRKRRSNPVLITLGAINPRPKKRGKTKMARRRRSRKANSTVVRRRRRRANPVSVAPRRRRRYTRRRRVSNPVSRRRVHRRSRRVHRRRRNPSVFGRSVASVGAVEMILGGLVGVTAAKIIPTYVPVQFLSSPILRILVTGASAWVASMLVGKVRPGMADAVMFGGLMQAGSVALNAFVPSIGGQIGLNGGRGMGDLVEGHFVVPQNPLRYIPPTPAPAQARVTVNGLSRAYGTAF